MSSEIFEISKRLFLHDSLQCQDYKKIRENEVLLGRQFVRSIFDGKRTSFKPKSFIIGMSVSKLTIKCEETAGSWVAKGTIYALLLAPQTFGPSAASELTVIIHKMPPEARIQVTRLSKISI